MMKRKTKPATDPMADLERRMGDLGIELPEAVATSKTGMRNVASFLIKHQVFDREQEDLLKLINSSSE